MESTQYMASAGDATLDALRRYGTDAVSFQALKAGTGWWIDDAAPAATGACVAYVQSGRSWIAIGTPLTEPGRRSEAVRRFIAAARAAGRRPLFFGVEDLTPFAGYRTLQLGLQSVLKPSEWDSTLRQRPKLREQLRRARAKGVTVRALSAHELAPGTNLRKDVERLRAEWLGSRHLEPMSFLVGVDPFYAGNEHVYFVAERRGASVQFLSAVPIYASNGWLMEDMLRGRNAPNGTTELVIDALMRQVGSKGSWITPGLTPLSGRVPLWLRLIRRASVALYDFSGLWRFRSRLRPSAWRPVWLVWDRGAPFAPLIDVLRAFAGGRLLAFAMNSLLRHPNGPPWAVAVPLVPWTIALAVLAASGRHDTLGFSSMALHGWVVFDAVLAWVLFEVARHPRQSRLTAVAAVAGLDALLSIQHLSTVGLGASLTSAVFRIVATAGPVIGTAALLWAAWRAAKRPA
jgi:phosphatidylglycerol lysyltransferase